MHVLIVPSEEFVPATNHTSAIFQYHQAMVLHEAGYKVGALSIRQEYSVPMIVRGAWWRLARHLVGNELDEKTLPEMGRLLRDKLAKPERFIRHEMVGPVATVRIDGFYYLPPSPRVNHLGWIIGGMQAFKSYVEKYGAPDVVHAHNLDSAGLLASRIRHEYGIPYVVTENSSSFHRDLIPPALFPRLASAAREASSFAAVSPALARMLQQKLALGGREVAVVPNVIDSDLLWHPIAQNASSDSGFSFLSIGNLVPVKNHEMLINAFSEAFPNPSNVVLRIGGEGELRGALMQLVHNLRMSQRISFLGRLDRREVRREIDACDALVLPSRYETFGVVLIEAMARGKPVISTVCGGPEAFVTKADGDVVPNEDQQALATAMTRMARVAASYDADDIRRRAVKRFGPKALLERLEPMYRKAVS